MVLLFTKIKNQREGRGGVSLKRQKTIPLRVKTFAPRGQEWVGTSQEQRASLEYTQLG